MESNAVELRLDAIESRLAEMEKSAESRVVRLITAFDEKARALLTAVERAVQPFVDERAAVEKLKAELEETAARLSRIELYCPECPRRDHPTPPPEAG